MTVTIALSLLVFIASIVAAGLGVLAHTIASQVFKWPGWACLWAALTIALFVMASIHVG